MRSLYINCGARPLTMPIRLAYLEAAREIWVSGSVREGEGPTCACATRLADTGANALTCGCGCDVTRELRGTSSGNWSAVIKLASIENLRTLISSDRFEEMRTIYWRWFIGVVCQIIQWECFSLYIFFQVFSSLSISTIRYYPLRKISESYRFIK